MRGGSRMGGGLLALILVLAACANAPGPTVTPTRAPTATLEVLPEQFHFDTLGYRLDLAYPGGWQADRWAQRAAVYAPTEALLPQVGLRLFSHYVGAEGQTLDLEGLVRWRPLWGPDSDAARRLTSDYFWSEIQDQRPDVVPFAWGDFPAAYATYRYQDSRLDAPVRKFHITLQLPGEDSFLVLWAAVPEADLADLAPVLRAMLASLTLDDVPLGAEPVLAVAQARAVPITPSPDSGDAPRDSWVGATPLPF